MRGAWISVVVTVTGCDVVYGLSGRADAAPPTADASAIDAAMPEQCAFGAPVQLEFGANVQPLHDFADDGSGRAFISAFITETITQSRSGALLDTGTWVHDLSARDTVGGFTGVRPEPTDPMQMYGLVTMTVTNYLARWQLESSGWEIVDMRAIDERERVGNGRVLDGKRVYVTTQKPISLDPGTRMVLRILDGESWNEEDRMAAINAAQIPDLGVLTRDGLTLIYSARIRSELQFDLYMSTRPSLADNFPIGTKLDAPNTDASEVEPWISGACDRLYFRRGPTFFGEVGQLSSIFVTTLP